jgi:hypothetical protein
MVPSARFVRNLALYDICAIEVIQICKALLVYDRS